MPRRGPPAKPSHLKVIAGNPGKYPINSREPRPRKEAPRRPAWLGPEARKAWRWITAELKAMGLLTTADAHALVAYCQLYARWRAADDFIEKHGETYPVRDEAGRVRCVQQFPQVAIARNNLLILKAYQQEFGLTPASRSRIQIGIDDAGESEKARRYFS